MDVFIQSLLPWYALHIKPGREKFVASLLRQKGYTEFLPLRRTVHHWSDRLKEVEVPLLPGYLFCRCNSLERLPVLTTPYVYSMLGGTTPEPVPDEEVGVLQALVASGLPVEPWPYLQIGQRVRLDGGPLRGLEGILTGSRNGHRFVVSVTLIQRSVAVEVDGHWIIPLKPVRSESACPTRCAVA
jgi:transcription antitermination factor NusG